jgi:hypothetical protein
MLSPSPLHFALLLYAFPYCLRAFAVGWAPQYRLSLEWIRLSHRADEGMELDYIEE